MSEKEKTIDEMKEEVFGDLTIPEYEAYLSYDDLNNIANYRTTELTYTSENGVESKMKVTRTDVALYGLRLALKSIGGEKVTETNVDSLIEKHVAYGALYEMFNKIWLEQVKKK